MAYKVIRKFKDTDSGEIYEVGETYPKHSKSKTTKDRLSSLLDGNNDYKKVYLEVVEEVEEVKEVEEVEEVKEVEDVKEVKETKATKNEK